MLLDIFVLENDMGSTLNLQYCPAWLAPAATANHDPQFY